ncbi:MAG: hypothetical protein M1826_001653 [Phylliscum demangeonii]|nr:MAG: hypothetical protein M1826_001653 [Phylliscum demangeonii]
MPSPSPEYYGIPPRGDRPPPPDIQPIGDEENLGLMLKTRVFIGVHPDTIMWSQFRRPAFTDADLELHRKDTCANCMAWILAESWHWSHQDPTADPPFSSGNMNTVHLAEYCQTILSKINIFGGVGRFRCHSHDFDAAQYRPLFDPTQRIYEIRKAPPSSQTDETRPLMLRRVVHDGPWGTAWNPAPGLQWSWTGAGARAGVLEQVDRATADGRRQVGRLVKWVNGVEGGLVKQLEGGGGVRAAGKEASLLHPRPLGFDALPAWARE